MKRIYWRCSVQCLILFRNECPEFSFSSTHFHVCELEEKNTAMACYYCIGPLGFWCCITPYINYSNITKGNSNWEKDWKASHLHCQEASFPRNFDLEFLLNPFNAFTYKSSPITLLHDRYIDKRPLISAVNRTCSKLVTHRIVSN